MPPPRSQPHPIPPHPLPQPTQPLPIQVQPIINQQTPPVQPLPQGVQPLPPGAPSQTFGGVTYYSPEQQQLAGKRVQPKRTANPIRIEEPPEVRLVFKCAGTYVMKGLEIVSLHSSRFVSLYNFFKAVFQTKKWWEVRLVF